MNHEKPSQNPVKRFFHNLFISYIPNSADNLKQIIYKVIFLISLVTLIVSACYLTNYFLSSKKQDNIIDHSRKIWHDSSETVSPAYTPDPMDALKKENSDFSGWISISNTKVDNPIYQTDNNDFYLNHNQKKQKSVYGALFFDSDNVIKESDTDSNLVIYGHEMKNGSMFGTLKKLRSLSFYQQNSTIEFSTLYKKSTYKIYAIFVLNASKADDNGYIYNIARKRFNDENDFNSWTAEAYERSLINTGVDTVLGDNIITLVTCSSDFENSRLIIMAREVRNGEVPADTSSAKPNSSPRYPKKWYDDRKIDFPFD